MGAQVLELDPAPIFADFPSQNGQFRSYQLYNSGIYSLTQDSKSNNFRYNPDYMVPKFNKDHQLPPSIAKTSVY